MTDRVLIVGYSPELIGGVVTATNLLIANIPYLDLHIALYCYRPRWKAVAGFAYSLIAFTARLILSPPRVIQPIIGSRGDAIRTLPFIVLGGFRGCEICLHFHKTREEIVASFPRIVRRLLFATWSRASCCCFVSNGQRNGFAEHFGPHTRHLVISNAISDSWLSSSVLPRSERARSLVYFGRWSAEKGIEDLLSLMELLKSDDSVRCDIYSDQAPRQLSTNCQCHSWLEEDAARQVLRNAMLLVAPSHAEAFGLVLLEAAACGTPYVSTAIGGIAEEGQAGLLHEVGDIHGMRAAVEQLLGDSARWTQLSQAGRQWAESLSISHVIDHWHRLYKQLGIAAVESLDGHLNTSFSTPSVPRDPPALSRTTPLF